MKSLVKFIYENLGVSYNEPPYALYDINKQRQDESHDMLSSAIIVNLCRSQDFWKSELEKITHWDSNNVDHQNVVKNLTDAVVNWWPLDMDNDNIEDIRKYIKHSIMHGFHDIKSTGVNQALK